MRWVVVAMGLLGASCVDRVAEKDHPCPCSEGWSCCSGTQICVPEGTSCGEVRLDGPGRRSDGEGPRVDAGSAPVECIPRSTECAGLGDTRTCNAAGTAFLAPEPCPDQQRCENGACIAANEVTGTINVTAFELAKQEVSAADPGEFQTEALVGGEFFYDRVTMLDPPSLGPDSCQAVDDLPAAVYRGTPFDVGPIRFGGLPGGDLIVTFDTLRKHYQAWLPTFDSHTNPFPGFGKTVSFSGAGGGLVHGPFSGAVVIPSARRLTRPGPREQLTAATSHPFEVTWSGATGAGLVSLVLTPYSDPPSGSLPPFAIQCDVIDDGAFTIPAATMSLLTTYPEATLMLRSRQEQELSAKGLSPRQGRAVVQYLYLPSRNVLLK